MKIGNTTYNLDAIREMSFKQFEKAYKGKINTDLKATFKQLGGKYREKKMQNKPKQED